uniref:Uncharacterized protein n=1 Tax=Glossina palpalis gambiensis TaxID=67801 RepID=A0A1B0B4S4_9MUSC
MQQPAPLIESDRSHDALIASVPSIGTDEQMNEQMKNCVSSVEISPNISEETATDAISCQLGLVPARKSIFISRLPSCTSKEAIVDYFKNKLSVEDARKCSVSQLSSSRH